MEEYNHKVVESNQLSSSDTIANGITTEDDELYLLRQFLNDPALAIGIFNLVIL